MTKKWKVKEFERSDTLCHFVCGECDVFMFGPPFSPWKFSFLSPSTVPLFSKLLSAFLILYQFNSKMFLSLFKRNGYKLILQIFALFSYLKKSPNQEVHCVGALFRVTQKETFRKEKVLHPQNKKIKKKKKKCCTPFHTQNEKLAHTYAYTQICDTPHI